ncbi:MAG: TIGR00730 family Rossman fold protein [Xanthobacteraceae bacterium]|nr:TIGR00730 family Rossman fold protein [Xanthobacteraceae bacterium]QYK45881.1 MAG: TIGR00730 family Rossman fold protein [Xanthobacteraceae bacterium]
MAEIKTVCVYCGSSTGFDPKYAEAARALGRALAEAKIALVFGGGGRGLMGELSRAARAGGGHVTGIVPKFLVESEQAAMANATEMIVVEDMHVRKRTMFERADAFVALPGAIGTLEELIEQMTWAQIGQHEKPMLLLNLDGYWDPLLKLFDRFCEAGFLRREWIEKLIVAAKPEEIVPALRAAIAAIPRRTLDEKGAETVTEKM